MLDNDYKLPSYIAPSDTRAIPGLDRNAIHAELATVLDHREGGGEIGAQPESYSMPGRNGATGPDGLPIKKNDEDEWVETAQAEGSPEGGLYPILAMDCEMVSGCLRVSG
jgi:RNA exonuclease 1